MDSVARNHAAFGALTDHLNCPICKELLREPYVTGCGHTFCHECIEHHLEKTSQKCPSCAAFVVSSQVKPVFAMDNVRDAGLLSAIVWITVYGPSCGRAHVPSKELPGKSAPLTRTHTVLQVLRSLRELTSAHDQSNAGQVASFLRSTPSIRSCDEIDEILNVLVKRRSELQLNQLTGQLQLLQLFLEHARCAQSSPCALCWHQTAAAVRRARNCS